MSIVLTPRQAIIRCLYAYFMELPQEQLPYIKVPLHTLIRISPKAYGCEEERYHLPIEAVDTHRPKPSKHGHKVIEMAEHSNTKRDYYGESGAATPQQKPVADADAPAA
jgi:6-phosphofructo-2-kinase/fructose-2,6-biphosphatase 2